MPYSEETKEEVLKLYVDKYYSINEVVNQTAIPFVTVQRWLKAKGKIRTMAEARKIRMLKIDTKLGRNKLLPKIKGLYTKERLALEKTAKQFHLGRYILRRWLKEEGYLRARGGRIRSKTIVAGTGYNLIYQPNHPRAHKSTGYVYEHILVWEKVHNRSLPEGWVIHHLNGIKTDNRPENLVAMSKRKHSEREVGGYYKKRIRELEAKVQLLERTLDSQQMIWWSEN